MILVTGGCGFIGSHFVEAGGEACVVLDKLTYAAGDVPATVVVGDVGDTALVGELLRDYRPSAVVHFAAETHVGNSLLDPAPFMRANVLGTFGLLEALRAFPSVRLVHISTDEVFGSVTEPAGEQAPLRPGNVYAASKASAEMLVHAYQNLYGLDVVVGRLSNVYGPRQHVEKLIPATITRMLRGEPGQIFGDGEQQRQWLYVRDAVRAVRALLQYGRSGESYNFPGTTRSVRYMVSTLAIMLDSTFKHTTSRLGEDRRYWMSGAKAADVLGWAATKPWLSGLEETVKWHRENL